MFGDIQVELFVYHRDGKTTLRICYLLVQGLEISLPARTTNGLTIESPFKLTYARLINDQTNFERLQDGWQVSKSLIFKNHITQS